MCADKSDTVHTQTIQPTDFKGVFMLDIQQIFQYTQDFGVAECEMTGDDELWVRGVDLTQLFIKPTGNKMLLTVWGGDDFAELIDATDIPDLDTLQRYLNEHAKLSNQTARPVAEPTLIEIYMNLIKEKLTEQQICLDFDKQTKAERLVVRHIENKLAEIIQFLQ